MLEKAVSSADIPRQIPLKLIEEARERIKGTVLRTPLVRLNVDDAPADIFLKLENLQPTGSFKVRGASNAIALAGPDAKNIQASFDEVWKVVVTHRYPPLDGSVFIHPFADIRMMAGNGTAGLEVLEDLPDVESVVIPFGGGGLSVGIASAIRAKRPQTRVYAVEPETAAPLSASFAAGVAKEIARTPSFVDGIGGKSVLPEIWERARILLLPLVVSLSEIAAAIKLLIERNRVVAEGAGAASVAAATTGKAGSGKIVCVVSGGNIDSSKLVKILAGGIP